MPQPETAEETAQLKAAALIEALPWLERFHGATVVVKYGGNAMLDESLQAAFAADMVFLRYAGIKPVVVHGGGPQISELLDKLEIPTEFKAGYRVTTPESMEVVRMVLTGKVGRELIGLINTHGPFAVGLSGEDAALFQAKKASIQRGGQPVDVGLVGEIVKVNTEAVRVLLDAGKIPVISTVAANIDASDPQPLNVNADTAAAALAGALGASKLIILTDVEGLYRDWPDRESLISQISAAELKELLPSLESGMIPKMTACLAAIDQGVPQAHIVDGRSPHQMLLEIFTNQGVGTLVTLEGA